jgi:uncharacterized membrane protein
MTQQQAQALLRQLAHINTREAKNSQRLKDVKDELATVGDELQRMRVLLVCDYHNRENDRFK